MTPYPLHLDLTGRRVLVVGGGRVAARRAAAAVAAGATVEVVAAAAGPDLPAGAAVTLRAFDPRDVAGAWLVLACTGAVDADVAAACEAAGIWCVRGDAAGSSAAWLPAVARSGDVVVSVTAGGDPRRATAIRDGLALALDAGEVPLRRHRPGPGSVRVVRAAAAPDLQTVRATRALAEADLVLDGTAGNLTGGDIAGQALDRAAAGADVVVVLPAGESADALLSRCRAAGVAAGVTW